MRRVEATDAAAPRAPLAEIAYDRHFLDHGLPTPWPFLERLAAPPPEVARLDGDMVVFPGGVRRPFDRTAIPDIATPAAPFLLAVPAARRIIAAAPYYLLRDKETRYAVTVFNETGDRQALFDALPTHALAGVPDVLAAPERTGCCETTAWTIRFFDLAAKSVAAYGCPPGECGDLVLARLDGGRLLLAIEEFETHLGEGAVVITRLDVVSPRGPAEASARFVHAIRDPSAGIASEGECASRVMAAERSPYAIRNLISVTSTADGAWTVRFATPHGPESWTFTGAAGSPAPTVSFPLRH